MEIKLNSIKSNLEESGNGSESGSGSGSGEGSGSGSGSGEESGEEPEVNIIVANLVVEPLFHFSLSPTGD